MTSVRFSPDGTYILSTGGDGCIMKWALPDIIINAIRERILELKINSKLNISSISNEKVEDNFFVSFNDSDSELLIHVENENISSPMPPLQQYSHKLSKSLPSSSKYNGDVSNSNSKFSIENQLGSEKNKYKTCVLEDFDIDSFVTNESEDIAQKESCSVAENWLEDMVSKLTSYCFFYSIFHTSFYLITFSFRFRFVSFSLFLFRLRHLHLIFFFLIFLSPFFS